MVVMITSAFNTSGEILIPGTGWNQSFSVAANAVTLVTMPSVAETIGSENIFSTGIRLTSLQPVAVYLHQYHSARSEATVVLPVASLGQTYFTMSYNGVTRNGIDYPSQFLVVATEDETDVTITVADATKGGRSKGSSHIVRLNLGETYQVQSARGTGDLTGSYVTASKKVAVFAGNTWTDMPIGCGTRDNLFEQMAPIETWGRRFVTVPMARMSFNVFRVLASENNTTVRVRDNVAEKVYTLQRGQFVEYQHSQPTTVIANRPIAVAQYSPGSQCSGYPVGDPSMVLLNAVEQTRERVTLYNSSFQAITENYITIITRTRTSDLVTFDGVLLSKQGLAFTPIAADTSFSYALIKTTTGSHTIDSPGCGVIAFAYGYGDVESYGYSGGANYTPINVNPIPPGGCLNDTVFFNSGLPPERYQVLWEFDDGVTSTEHSFWRIFRKLGDVPVTLTVRDFCLETEEHYASSLSISLRQAVSALPQVTVCTGELLRLEATDLAGAQYQWQGPQDYFAEVQFPQLTNIQPLQSGRYQVVGIIAGCATFPAYTQVDVVPTPRPALGNDAIICTDSPDFDLMLSPGEFARYRWQDGSQEANFPVLSGGVFQVQVWDEFGCTGSDTLELEEQCPTQIYVPTAFSPNGDQINDLFQAYPRDVITFQLRIFDRWGTLLFTTSNPQGTWDGNFRNLPAPIGTYVWTIEGTGYRRNGKEYAFTESGTVQLIR